METVETFESLKGKRTIFVSLFLLMQFPQFPCVLWTVSTTVSQLPCSFQLLGPCGCPRRPPGYPRASCGHTGLLWVFQKSHAGVPGDSCGCPRGPCEFLLGPPWIPMVPDGSPQGPHGIPLCPHGSLWEPFGPMNHIVRKHLQRAHEWAQLFVPTSFPGCFFSNFPCVGIRLTPTCWSDLPARPPAAQPHFVK